ncbi:magnesium transporter [archaeon]|nr:magnesium transporter [archaeon]
MMIFDKKFKEIFTSQIVSIVGGLIVGTILAVQMNKLIMIPGLFFLLPGFLEMRGNISASFASRISSGLFLGVINPEKLKTKIILGNLIASFLLVIISSLFLGSVSFLFSYFLLKILNFKIIYIALVAGIISNIIEIPLTLLATIYLFKKGHDPNNIIGPFVTSTGDITSILSLLIALVIV